MADKGARRERARTVRVEDVAREAGVSPITVSRALSDPGKVREETRRRVAEAVQKTGYVVNRFASSLRSGRSTIISAFVSNLANPHFANALQGCADALEGGRYHLLMAQTGYSDRLESAVVDEVLPFRPAAALFTGIVQSRHTRATLRKLGIPVIEMWDYRPDPIDMLVGFANAEGGRLIGAHFRERGYGKVAYAGRTLDRGAQRLQGFTEGFGRAPDYVLKFEGSRRSTDGMAALDTILAAVPGVRAIFFGTDLLAVGASFLARERGIAIPGDLALAGYGDWNSRGTCWRRSRRCMSRYDMGRTAGQMLPAAAARDRPEPIVLSPIRPEVRESTGG